MKVFLQHVSDDVAEPFSKDLVFLHDVGVLWPVRVRDDVVLEVLEVDLELR